MFFRNKVGSKKKRPLFTRIPTTAGVSTETLPDDVPTRTLPATTTRRSTTEMQTMLTTPRTGMVTHEHSSASQDGTFIITTMSVVVGVVFILILIVIIAFLLKSRRRRRWNVRIYRDNQARHAAAVSLDATDGDDHSHMAINGVHQAIYGQDISHIPIRTFRHPEKKSSTQQGGNNTTSSESISQNVGCSQSSKEIVYENNGIIVKPNSAPVCDHPIKLGPNGEINNVLVKRLQTQGLNKEQHSDCDYEKVFPEPGKQINSDNLIKNKAVQSTSMLINKCTTSDECLTNKNHTRATTAGNRKVNLDTEIQMGKAVETGPQKIKERPKIKPKPVMLTGNQEIRKQTRTAELHEHPVVSPKPLLKEQNRWRQRKNATNKSIEKNKDEPVSPDYENSLVNIKRTMHQDAQLLKTVSPPCNTNTYYGNTSKDEHKNSANSLLRQSSGYEDPDNVLALQTQAQDHYENGHVLETQENHKPEYSNIATHRNKDPNLTESATFDYENSDTVNELRLTKKIVGQRSFSASSLSSRPFANFTTGTMNVQEMKTLLRQKENDEMYLPMDMTTMKEDMYIAMDLDTSTDDVYLSMNVTADDVYMPMERTDSYTQSDSPSTKLLHSLGTSCHNLDTGNLAAPKPCGGRVAYVNISDRQSKYVNLFRSRSTDDVNTYADYVNFKSCTDLTRKERQKFI